MLPSDRTHIRTLLDRWLSACPGRSHEYRWAGGLWYSTLTFPDGREITTVSSECREAAAAVGLMHFSEAA